MAERPDSPLILVAEDHDLTRRMLVRCLKPLSPRVLETGSGAELLELIAREAPALVALDLDLSDGPRGVALCRAVRAAARGASTRIIAGTTYEHNVRTKIELLQAGADTYFQKDEPVGELLIAARMLLEPSPAVRRELSAPTVLLIDDDEGQLEGLSTAFRLQGFAPRTALSAPIAILHVLEARPDAVLLDYAMPKLNGLEALRILRSLPGTGDVPILMLTAKDDLDLEALCLREGADGYLVKGKQGWGDIPTGVRNLLRRLKEDGNAPLSAPRLSVDPLRRLAFVDGEPVRLTRQDLDFLSYLMRRSPRTVTWRELQLEIGGFAQSELRDGTVPIIETALARLRTKLGPVSHYLGVERNVGVLFVPG
ncbi:MAG: response regulator [Elusimicrobiota bacterium]|jgi:DNA-binding response OmpR family regulator